MAQNDPKQHNAQVPDCTSAIETHKREYCDIDFQGMLDIIIAYFDEVLDEDKTFEIKEDDFNEVNDNLSFLKIMVDEYQQLANKIRVKNVEANLDNYSNL